MKKLFLALLAALLLFQSVALAETDNITIGEFLSVFNNITDPSSGTFAFLSLDTATLLESKTDSSAYLFYPIKSNKQLYILCMFDVGTPTIDSVPVLLGLNLERLVDFPTFWVLAEQFIAALDLSYSASDYVESLAALFHQAFEAPNQPYMRFDPPNTFLSCQVDSDTLSIVYIVTGR